MSKVIENYVLLEVIGSGQYGKVYRAKNIKNEQIVAIKVVQLEKFREVPKLHEFTMNEIRTLTKIDNPNCVKFQEMLKTSNNMYLIYEYCNGGTLEQAIHKRKFLSEQESIKIFSQLLNAFKSIIKENILHRDLKPSNILIHNNIIKIADFGFCKSLSHSHDMTATMVGSPIYMAPEVLKGMSYNSKADIWSLGVVFFECLFGYCPYEDQSIGKLITQIDNKELQIPRYINQISKKAEDLLRAMLVVDQKKRVEWHVLYQMTEEKFNVNIQQLSNQPISNNFQTQLMKKNSSSNLALQSNQQQNGMYFLNNNNVPNNNNNSNNQNANNFQHKNENNSNKDNFQQFLNQAISSQQDQTLASTSANNLTNNNLLQFNNTQNTNNNNTVLTNTNTIASTSNNSVQQPTFQIASTQIAQHNSNANNFSINHHTSSNQISSNKLYTNNFVSSFQNSNNNVFSANINNTVSSNGGNNLLSSLNNLGSSNNLNIQPTTTKNNTQNLNYLNNNNSNSNINLPLSANKDFLNSVPSSINNNCNEDKQKITGNLRLLLKERNKIQFISNLIANLLEINLTSRVPIIAFLLIKQLNVYIDQLKNSCNDLKQSSFSKNLEKVDLFENSYEFKQFKSIINRELPLIQGVFENFKNEINRYLKQQGNIQESIQLKNEINTINQIDQVFFQQSLFSYIQEVQTKANELLQYQMQYGQQNNQFLQLQSETKQTFLHLNEMIDCFLIEDLFDNFIDINTKFYEQKYFDSLKKYKVESLQELVNHKFDYIKQKINQIAVS